MRERKRERGGLDQVQLNKCSTYVRAMTPQIVVGAQRIVHVLAAMRCGECDAHNAPYIARGQPSLLIVVGAIQLPALILQSEKKNKIENLFESIHKWQLGRSPKQPPIDRQMRPHRQRQRQAGRN